MSKERSPKLLTNVTCHVKPFEFRVRETPTLPGEMLGRLEMAEARSFAEIS